MRTMIELASSEREVLIDITDRLRMIVAESGVEDGLCCVYAHGGDHDPGELGRQRSH